MNSLSIRSLSSSNKLRPDWDEYFMGFAEAAAARADCTRRKAGAVIARNNRIVSAGYNGAPAGMPGCLTDGACPRGRHYAKTLEQELREQSIALSEALAAYDTSFGRHPTCGCGHPWPCPDYTKPFSAYDNCIAIHAEANAIIYADNDKMQDASIYITCEPCHNCTLLIQAAGIREVIIP